MAFPAPLVSSAGLKALPAFSGHSSSPTLDSIPVELVLKIIGCLDLKSIFNLAKSSKTLKKIYDSHREAIVLSTLRWELSPFDELLQFIVVQPQDFELLLGPCLRRRIYHKSKLLSDGEPLESDDERQASLKPVMLAEEHFDRVLQLFKVVKGWEQLFPRYRFSNASDCRELHQREAQRLRGALYHWMTYAWYFQGDLSRPNKWIPQKSSSDIRCKRIRLLSCTQLHELEDLWKVVRVIVEQEICPSTEMVQKEMDWSITKEEASRIGFGSATRSLMRATFNWNDSTFVDFDTNVNTAIVDTILKLTPAELLHFANNRSAYSKERLTREVRLANPRILEDRQSLSHALSAVMEERAEECFEALVAPVMPADMPAMTFSTVSAGNPSMGYSGGILDFVDGNDLYMREGWSYNGRRARVDDHPVWGIRIAMNRGRLES